MAITAGGGAAAVVVDIVNAMWDNAQKQTDKTGELVAKAIALADPAPSMEPVVIQADYDPPEAPAIPDGGADEAERIYDAKRMEMETLLTRGFGEFLVTYFPVSPSFQGAVDWLYRAITTGGTGINAGVEQALWQRGRARVLADSERAKDEAMATWANRRFPIPPGALTNSVNQINLDAGRKLAEQSRDISVKSFEAELENVRFAVKEAIDLRLKAMDAAGDYIKTLMLGPQTAMQLATGLAGIESEMARTMVAMFSAQIAAAEPTIRLAIAQGDLSMRSGQANMASETASMEAKVKAGLAGAQMAAAQASAGINGINGQAAISGSDSSQV
jgi:hypothetical protein